MVGGGESALVCANETCDGDSRGVFYMTSPWCHFLRSPELHKGLMKPLIALSEASDRNVSFGLKLTSQVQMPAPGPKLTFLATR